MTEAFYQDTWSTIGDDVYNTVKAFYYGDEISRYITHTNLVLIPKEMNVTTFSHLRAISLSNFISKFFSRIVRIVHERIKEVLSKLISKE